LPKLKEVRCEVCNEPVDLLRDYADELSGKSYTPREWVEHQLKMTPEEQEARQRFFNELFAQHNAKRAAEQEAEV
jgi:hypothetical protein